MTINYSSSSISSSSPSFTISSPPNHRWIYSLLILCTYFLTLPAYEFGLASPRKVSDLRWSNPTGLVGFKGTNLLLKWEYTGDITSSSTVSISYAPAAGLNKGVVTSVVTQLPINNQARRLEETTTLSSSSSSSLAIERKDRLLPLMAYDGSGSYNFPVPNNFPTGGQYWFNITVDGGSGSNSVTAEGTRKNTDILFVYIETSGARSIAPLVDLGQDTDQLYTGAVLNMKVRVYNFDQGDEVIFRLFYSATGWGCDVVTFFWHADGHIRIIHGVTSEIVIFGYGYVKETNTGNTGEDILLNYTLPPPAHLFLPPMNHYVVAAYWVNKSTVPKDPTERAPTLTGYPVNVTARSHCYDHFGLLPNEFPAIGPLTVPGAVTPGTTVSLTWKSVLVPMMDKLEIKLYKLPSLATAADTGTLITILDSAARNTFNWTWAVDPSLTSGRYYVLFTSHRYRVSVRSRSFRVVDITALVSVAVTSPIEVPNYIPSLKFKMPVKYPGDSVTVSFDVALRNGGVPSTTNFAIDLYITDRIASYLVSTVSSSVSVAVPGSGTFTHTLSNSLVPGAYFYRIRSLTNSFVGAISSTFAVAQSSGNATALSTDFFVQYHNPTPNITVFVGYESKVNFTVSFYKTGAWFPTDLTNLVINVYRGASNPVSTSNNKPVFNPSTETYVKTLKKFCLQKDTTQGCYPWDIISEYNLGRETFTTEILLPVADKEFIPGNNYFFAVTSYSSSYQWLFLRSPIFNVQRHSLRISDIYNYWNTTSYASAAAIRPGEIVELNVSSTLSANDKLDIILMNADPFNLPDDELASASLTVGSAVSTILSNHPGNGICVIDTNNYCNRVIRFKVPNVKTTNVVYVIAFRNAKLGAYTWAFFYMGQVDENGGSSVSIAKPDGSKLNWIVGEVMTIQWITKGVAFSAPMKVTLTDPQGFDILIISDTVSNEAGTLKWTIPLSFCSDPVGVLGKACNNTIRLRVAVAKNDVLWRMTTAPMRIQGLPQFISVTEPSVSTVWTANQTVVITWSSVNIPPNALCSVSLFQGRYFTAKGDRFVQNITESIRCDMEIVSFTVPMGIEAGWPAYVVVYAYGIPTQVWGRSSLFILRSTLPRSVLDILNQACPQGKPIPGVSGRLCAQTCTECAAQNGVWMVATTVSFDFDIFPWYGSSDDLAVLKSALGAVRTTGINLCWIKPSVGATRPIEKDSLPVTLANFDSSLYVPGTGTYPFLRVETGNLGSDCTFAPIMRIPITVAAAGPVTMAKSLSAANYIRASSAALLAIPENNIVVTVEEIALRETTKEDGSGSIPVVTSDSKGRTSIPFSRRLGSPFQNTEIRYFNENGKEAVVNTSSCIPHLTSYTYNKVYKNSRRELQEFPAPPEGPAMSALISLQLRITTTTTVEAEAAGEALTTAPYMLTAGPGITNIVLGAPRIYTATQLSSVSAALAETTDLYALDMVAVGATQTLSQSGGLAPLTSVNAYSDGTAAFQMWLANDRLPKPPPWSLSPGEIAAIVLCLLFACTAGTWYYLDRKYKLWFYVERPVKPKKIPPPPPPPDIGPSIEDALSLHDEISQIAGDKPLPKLQSSPMTVGGGRPVLNVEDAPLDENSTSIERNPNRNIITSPRNLNTKDRPYIPLSVTRTFEISPDPYSKDPTTPVIVSPNFKDTLPNRTTVTAVTPGAAVKFGSSMNNTTNNNNSSSNNLVSPNNRPVLRTGWTDNSITIGTTPRPNNSANTPMMGSPTAGTPLRSVNSEYKQRDFTINNSATPRGNITPSNR